MYVDWKDLPEFDTVGACAACGINAEGLVLVTFLSEFRHNSELVRHVAKDISFMRRTCPRCGYHWREKPLYLCQEKGGKHD